MVELVTRPYATAFEKYAVANPDVPMFVGGSDVILRS